jgi:hypothetical protein
MAQERRVRDAADYRALARLAIKLRPGTASRPWRRSKVSTGTIMVAHPGAGGPISSAGSLELVDRIKDRALELTLHLALPIVGCALSNFASRRVRTVMPFASPLSSRGA